jgi:2-polyprenyl-3-methyl-5-hydroxy-6-metoxy-1,4-benzoquinol methylase
MNLPCPSASPDQLEHIARNLYRQGPWLMRKLMHYRIRICPFGQLLAAVPPYSTVLDVGCGAGLFLALLAGTVEDIQGVGFDSSGVAIATARYMEQRVRELGLRAQLRFERLDATDPWPEGTFDIVSLVDVLHHVPRNAQKTVFETAVSKVNPGGLLIYKDMAERPLFHAWMNRLHDLVLARQWIHYVPAATADRWASACGLEVAFRGSATLLWYQHDLRLYKKPL